MINLNKIFDLICQIQAISNYAYDIHYSARGSFFYSDHLFSERVGDVEEISEVKDDLIETVYLGRGKDAPLSEDISLRVAEITPEVSKDTQTNFKRLRDLIISALVDIEDLKELTRGEEDLIGSLAHILQRHNGLLYRQLDYADTEVANERDIDWITVKGNHIPIPKGATEEEKAQAINDFFKKREQPPRAGKDSSSYLADTRKNEEKITKEITDLAKKAGVENIGLDFRLKTEKSALRKAKEERKNNPNLKSDKQALKSMWDLVRYTQGGTPDNLVEKGKQTLSELQSKGYKVYQIKNYWLDENSPYKGINVKMLSPEGQKFELQFHTPHNAGVKEKLHKVYEKDREETNPEKKKKFHDEMMEISKEFEPIKGAETFTLENIIKNK